MNTRNTAQIASTTKQSNKQKSKKHLAFGVEPQKVKYRLRLARYPALVESINQYVAKAPADSKTKLLDIGVGHGRTFKFYRHQYSPDLIEWHGVDRGRLPEEQVSGENQWQIKVANVEEGLPYPDDHFDVIVAEQILEHLHTPAEVSAEIVRITRTGGMMIIGVPIFPGWIAALRNWYVRNLPWLFKLSGSDHHQTFSLKTIRKLLEKNPQLQIQEVRGFRVFSGGPLRPLENYRWWYRFNQWLGKKIPSYCVEVQLVCTKL